MGILSDRLIAIEPWLQDSADHETTTCDNPEAAPLTTGAATVFLDWRWAMPATRTAAPLPAQMPEQPLFDALHAPETWSVEDGSLFVELDGFLIDRQTAAAASAYFSAPIAA
ncbi:hypothetical protein J2T09_001176 [Neorhizobium huautlense]|uniref:Uncharacterized protein n=1 Tax=Neorhizobium huautlense TaxID=67774 RepID=A0ABT9PPN4_9HYPH|nr:hypothetical protein [Neorhizobium huautlense]MDP9836432.1 hypothetical protein [Neorhizobium huautlense]